MNRSLNFDLTFPIRDKSSAQLMALKAKCLRQAGVIDLHDEEVVLRKSAEVLASDAKLMSGRGVSIKAYSHQPSKYGFAA